MWTKKGYYWFWHCQITSNRSELNAPRHTYIWSIGLAASTRCRGSRWNWNHHHHHSPGGSRRAKPDMSQKPVLMMWGLQTWYVMCWLKKKKLWFNIAMENPQNKWRLRSLGKSSISIRAIEKPWQTVSHNQRVILGYSMGIGTAPRHLWEWENVADHLISACLNMKGKKPVVATSIEKMMIYRWMEWYDPVYTILWQTP